MSSANPPIVSREPQPTGLGRKEIENLAESFADRVGFRPGADVYEIVKSLGGSVEVRDLDELTNQTGSLEVRDRGDFTIFIPPYTGRLRDRFTIAHELGHYVLHSRLGKVAIRVSRAESNPVEWEANWFAAALLMPEGAFREEWSKSGSSVWTLAVRFDVSQAAVEVRKRSLGLDETNRAATH